MERNVRLGAQRSRVCLLLVSLVMVVSLAFQRPAAAAPLFDWDGDPTVTSVVDQTGEDLVYWPDGTAPNLETGQDITKIWWGKANEGGTWYHYFRMDLNAAPSGDNRAGVYGIYLDFTSGGRDGMESSGDDLVPATLKGIDAFVQVERSSTQWHTVAYQEWNGSMWMGGVVTSFQATENGGKTLEWKIPESNIGGSPYITPYSIWGSTTDRGSEYATYDLTPGLTVNPEPGTTSLILLAVAAGGAVVRRKKGEQAKS